MKRSIAFLFLLASFCLAQPPLTVPTGGVRFAAPVIDWWGINAFDFVLYSGLPPGSGCQQSAGSFGYNYCGPDSNAESFWISYTNQAGLTMQYVGTVGKRPKQQPPDSFGCYVVTFPVVNGTLTVTAMGGNHYSVSGLSATYSQTWCDYQNGRDMWWAGGDLTVEIPQH